MAIVAHRLRRGLAPPYLTRGTASTPGRQCQSAASLQTPSQASSLFVLIVLYWTFFILLFHVSSEVLSRLDGGPLLVLVDHLLAQVR